MKVVISKSKTYGVKIKKIIEIAIAKEEKAVKIFSSLEVKESLIQLFKCSSLVKKQIINNREAFVFKGVLIEIELIDIYE